MESYTYKVKVWNSIGKTIVDIDVINGQFDKGEIMLRAINKVSLVEIFDEKPEDQLINAEIISFKQNN